MYTESKQTAQRTNTWRKAARWLDAQSSQYSVRSRATNWWALGSTLWSIVSSLSSLTFISMTTSRTCDSSLSNSSSASCSHSLQPQTPASSSSLLLTGSSDTVCDTCGCHMTDCVASPSEQLRTGNKHSSGSWVLVLNISVLVLVLVFWL